MIQRVHIEKKGNGVVVVGEDEDPEVDDTEIVLEEGIPNFETRIGAAALKMLKKPRKSPERKGATE